MEALGLMKISGNTIAAASTDLTIQKSAGEVLGVGVNWPNNEEAPHVVAVDAQDPVTMRYVLQDDSVPVVGTTNIDPNYYDNNAVLTAVPNNKFVMHHFFMAPSGLVFMQYGQFVYANMEEAKNALSTEAFTPHPSAAYNTVRLGVLIVEEGTTDLSDTTRALFINSDKFGSNSAGGGTSLVSMQQAYNNSSNPEITTSDSLGAINFRRGTTGGNSDNVVTVQDSLGTNNLTITGEGALDATAISVSGSAVATQTYVDSDIATVNARIDSEAVILDTLIAEHDSDVTVLEASIATKLNTADFSTEFDSDLATKTTTDIVEGTNLYFTNERVDDRVGTLVQGGSNITVTYNDSDGTLTIDGTTGGLGYDLSANSTSDLSEGSNLYYTVARARTAISAGTGLLYDSDTGVISYIAPVELDKETLTSTDTDQKVIATFSSTTYGGAKLIVKAHNSVTGERHIVEILVTHNGTQTDSVEYGEVITSAVLANYTTDISGGNVRLLATPASTNSTKFTVVETLLEI
jgi:hypothetical protein